MAFGEAVQPSTEPFGCNPDNALDRGVLLIRFVVHGPTVGDHTGARSSGSEVDKPASFTTSKMSAGRTSPALAGSGVGCGLAGPHAARCSRAEWRLAGRHLTCPKVIHSLDHLLSVCIKGMWPRLPGQR